MRAGILKDRITFEIQTASDGADEWGEAGPWVSDGDVWASVTPTAATENAKADGVNTQNAFTVRTRYRDGIGTQHRIIWNERTLDIVSVIDVDNRHRELLIEAKEHPARG